MEASRLEKPILLITLDGNIGAGKSELIESLQRNADIRGISFFQEPIQEIKKLLYSVWNDYISQTEFQIHATNVMYLHMRKCIKEAISKGHNTIVFERDVLSAISFVRCIDTLYFRDRKLLVNSLISIIHNLFFSLVKEFNIQRMERVLLFTPPEVCIQRIDQRNREGEDKIPLSYLTQLNFYQVMFRGMRTKKDFREDPERELFYLKKTGHHEVNGERSKEGVSKDFYSLIKSIVSNWRESICKEDDCSNTQDDPK